MKNKTKLWRRNAVKANRSAGAKYQGRKWKYLSYIEVGKVGMYPLLRSLMKNADLLVQPKVEATE